MQFNSHATNQDCVSEVLKICKATLGKYPLVDITRRFNFALDRYFTIAFENDGRFSFDDINQSNPPIDTQNLVAGTNKYKLSAFTEKIFNVLRLEVLDSAGVGHVLKSETFDSLPGSFEETYKTTVAGIPYRYLKLGDYLYLRDCPNYSLSSGLKIYFERPASYMASTDTTKVPGVSSMHHQYLCRMTSLPYLVENSMSNKNDVAELIKDDEEKIANYFAHREKDVKAQIRTAYYNPR